MSGHTHAEFREVARVQRGGEPARVYTESVKAVPTVEVSDAMFERVRAFGASRGQAPAEATDYLLGVGVRRLAALKRWQRKARARQRSAEMG